MGSSSGADAPPPATPGPQSQPHALNWFASLTLAMSTICILAGGITSFHVGFCAAGGAAIGIGWPLGCLFALVVALTMGEAASAYPDAGGPCLWAARLSGRNEWGWVAGCFNLAGLITATAAVNRGLCDFGVKSMANVLDYDARTVSDWIPTLIAAAITLTQLAIALRGMKLTARLVDVSGVLIVIVAILLTGCLIGFALAASGTLSFSRLVTFTNFSGPAGDSVVPLSGSMGWVFMLSLLLPAYTMTGYDSSAQTSEETDNPGATVPYAMRNAVLISGAAGWVMLSALIVAVPNLNAAAAVGEASFFHILRGVIPERWVRLVLYLGMDVAQYACGLACLTASSRLTWAMARFHGLPFSGWLGTPATLGPNDTPERAIVAAALVAVAFILFVPYTAIAAVCATFLYVSYVVPAGWGLFRYQHMPARQWTLGVWYRPLAAVSVLWCGVLIVISVQPPNMIAIPILAGMVVGLIGLWYLWTRHHFHLPAEQPPAAPKQQQPGTG